MAERIDVDQARQHIQAHPETLLVCAYDSAEKCRTYTLEGAIPLDEFQRRADHLPHDREIIFYCA